MRYYDIMTSELTALFNLAKVTDHEYTKRIIYGRIAELRVKI